jgi:hypothetical protein
MNDNNEITCIHLTIVMYFLKTLFPIFIRQIKLGKKKSINGSLISVQNEIFSNAFQLFFHYVNHNDRLYTQRRLTTVFEKF